MAVTAAGKKKSFHDQHISNSSYYCVIQEFNGKWGGGGVQDQACAVLGRALFIVVTK